jgi:Domain of unknown function (DUF4326)
MPIRIQRKRTKGWKMPPNTVYVGRPSYWGNMYRVGKLSSDAKYPVSNEQAVAFYRQRISQSHYYFLEEIKESLKGKNLACWCPLDQPCHADVLLEIANSGDQI